MNKESIFTNFGFKRVSILEKTKLVKEVFSRVADKYDLMNDLMSLGIHRLWKKQFVSYFDTKHSLLDIGSGSADIAIEFLNSGGKNVIVSDINQNMLKKGVSKILRNGYQNYARFLCADAENLPLKDKILMQYSISFCLRNIADIKKALQEAYRVLDNGGKIFCLEFSKVTDQKTLDYLYNTWLSEVIPKIGKIFANDIESYKYLAESIKLFYSQEELKELFAEAGFKNVRYVNINKGIACIHIGTK